MKYVRIDKNYVLTDEGQNINLEKIKRIWSSIEEIRNYKNAKILVRLFTLLGIIIIISSYFSEMTEHEVTAEQIPHIYSFGNTYDNSYLKTKDGSVVDVKIGYDGKWYIEKNIGVFLLFSIIGILCFIGAGGAYIIYINDYKVYMQNDMHVVRLIGESFHKDLVTGNFEETKKIYNEIKNHLENIQSI